MSTITDYRNLGKIDVFLPDHKSRKIRLADIGYVSEQDGDLRYAPYDHSRLGIASYTYLGSLGDTIIDPGIGKCGVTSEEDDYFGMQLVISTTDKNGLDIAWPITMMFFMFGFLEVYNVFIYLHSKTDPKPYMGLFVFDLDGITDEDDNLVGFAFNVYPAMMSMTYDAGEDEYTEVPISNNDEVVMSWDLAFNPGYIGSMGTQDDDEVSIGGGTISGTKIYSPPLLQITAKDDTGDPDAEGEGQMYVNTFDKLVRIYAGGAWRTLLDFG